jgi:hypothetical protein
MESTEAHKAIVQSVYNGERSAKEAIAAAREAGISTPRSWRRMVVNAEYIAATHRAFKGTTEEQA